jgi:hypothetical protein
MAREGARWASVHGGQWAADQDKSLTTPADVYNSAILPHAAGLDPSKLTYSVTWDDASELPAYPPTGVNYRTNKVTVTVNYSWVPELYLGSMTLTSTSVTTISY